MTSRRWTSCSKDADDRDLATELAAGVESLAADLEKVELAAMLSGEYDANDAIATINAGAGGTESQDWAEMLLRMYMRWGEEHGFKVEVDEIHHGEEAGIKSATFQVHGPNAYGLLSAERGVHRLVRISPFDAQKRRHTSFASLDVIPTIDEAEAEDIEIDEKDLRIDVYRSSGPGGQSVNTTDSAVRITHSADRCRRRLPERAVADAEPGGGDDDPEGAPGGARAPPARGADRPSCAANARRSTSARRSAPTCWRRTRW